MNVQTQRQQNGKIATTLSKKGYSIIGGFHCEKVNMFISELSKSRPTEEMLRKFVLSIRLDGTKEDSGKHKLTQMSFDEQELMQLRDEIDKVLANRE